MKVIVIGAGGHGQVVAEMLMRACVPSAPRPVGYLDDDAALIGTQLLGLPVLGALDEVRSVVHEATVIAIGDNATRRRLFLRFSSCGETFIVTKHPSCIIADDVTIGAGTMICAGAIVNTRSSIGRNAILNTGAIVEHHNVIGDHVHIAPGARLGGAVTVGEGTLVGIGATVLPGRSIGSWAVVGAGAVVVDDIPPNAIAVGVPARLIGRKNR